MMYDIVIEGIYTFTNPLSGHLTTFHSRNGKFELYPGRLGNFFVRRNTCGCLTMVEFQGKDLAFVSKWLTKRDFQKSCSIFKAIKLCKNQNITRKKCDVMFLSLVNKWYT